MVCVSRDNDGLLKQGQQLLFHGWSSLVFKFRGHTNENREARNLLHVASRRICGCEETRLKSSLKQNRSSRRLNPNFFVIDSVTQLGDKEPDRFQLCFCVCFLLPAQPDRRFGGAQPGNRFVSSVRAYPRSGCLVELDLKSCGP